MHFFLRAPLALLAFAALAPVLPAQAQVSTNPPNVSDTQTVGRPVQTAKDPWLYEKSDLVHDDAWKFGRLPNGVR